MRSQLFPQSRFAPASSAASATPARLRDRFAHIGAALALALGAQTAMAADLVINEVDYDQVDADTAEFIELKNVSGSAIELSNYSVTLHNGATGTLYDTFVLPSLQLPAGAYFVICGNAATTPNCDLDDLTDSNLIQNGTVDGIRINRLAPTTGLEDGFSYEGSQTGTVEGTGTTGGDSNADPNTGFSRIPDGADTDDNNADFDYVCITPGYTNTTATGSTCPAPTQIPDDPIVSLVSATASVAEGNVGNAELTFSIDIDPLPVAAVSFEATIAAGAIDGIDGSDIQQALGTPITVNFDPATDTAPFDFIIDVVGDSDFEPNETLTLTLDNFSAELGNTDPLVGTGTITNDDVSAVPTISIAGASVTEGASATTASLDFVITTTGAAAGDITFAIAVNDVTATAGSDYVDNDVPAFVIPAANIPGTTTFSVTVNGDGSLEADETLTVVLSAPQNGTLVQDTATGTINDDDFLAIAQVQGTAQTSPFAGQNVVVRGIVTAKASGSFWIQDGSCATFPNASCGLLVFGNAATALVTIGDEVEVAGPLIEFIPGADPASLPITEISVPTSTTVLSQGNALPAPVDLSLATNIPITNGPLDQLERFEGMRVTVPEFEVTVPTNNGEYASTNSSGTFFGVIAGTPRPKREPGIDVQNALPVGNTATSVPRWDFNSELIRVKTNLLTGSTSRDLPGRTIVTDLVGVLDYGFRRYTILPDPAAPFVTIAAPTPAAVSAPTSRQFTISTFNVENLLSTNGNYDRKADKITTTIVEVLNLPDVIGFVEMGNQTTIDDLAARINAAAIAAMLPDPQYVGRVVNQGMFDQEVAVMYKTGAVAPSLPRVNLVSIAQFGTTETLRCNDPDGPGPMTGADTGDVLNDRPPLVAELEVNAANGVSFPVTVIVNHLKALSGVDSEAAPDPGFECFVSDGARNRAKRHQGAVYLAGLVQGRQLANPDENIVLVGDFNAYQFNDGLVDVMGTVLGVPAADDATVQPDDGLDLVNPDLSTLISTVTNPDEAYSYIFGGQAQILDHIIVNDDVLADTAPRLEYAHVNADFRRTTDGNDTSTIYRSSDHDPSVAYFTVTGFGTPPSIDAIADQAIDEDETLSNLAFGVDDVEDGAALTCASVSVASDNTTLVPVASVTVTGAAQSCMLSLTPAANLSGTANITLTLTDSEGDSSQESFEVTVAPLNDAPTISTIGDVTISANVPGEAGFTIADIEETLACSAANLSATSSNTTLLPVANIVFSGSGGDCIATLTPAVGQSGTSDVTITVSDGTASDASSFQLSVTQGGFVELIFEDGFED